MVEERSPLPHVPLDRTPSLARMSGVVHGFTSRRGGVAPAPFDTLTLARADGVDDAVVVENWHRVLDTLGVATDALALVTQVHGAEVVVAREPSGPLGVLGEADALVSTTPGLAIAVRVADCVPLLLAVPGGVAAVHAGWRGAAAGIAPRALEVLCAQTGAAAREVVAGIGPCIAGSAYEVGPEVVEALEATGVSRERFARPGRGDRWWCDVADAVTAQLEAAGVPTIERIVDGCTTASHRYSWRADGPTTGRQAGVIAWCG